MSYSPLVDAFSAMTINAFGMFMVPVALRNGADSTSLTFVRRIGDVVGALIFLQKLRISPDAAFSVNDWTAFVIFIVVIGGIGTLEGPIIGTLVFFALRETLAELGTIYLMVLGLVAIVIMLKAPKGLWGLLKARFDLQLFPLGYRVSGQSSKKDT